MKIDPNYLPKVSLLICAYNEEKTITQKIENALRIDYPTDKLEIIVFDNGSEDKTYEIASSFSSSRIHVLRLNGKNRGKSFGINEALRNVTGEIVKISDADCLYEGNILGRIVPYFADPCVGAICVCQSFINPEESITSKLERSLQSFYHLFHGAEAAIDSIVIGEGGLTFKRNLIDKLDENVGADDIDLTVRIRKNGHRVLYLKDTYYYEHIPTTFYTRWKQKVKRSALIISALIRHREVMFNRKLGFYGEVIYPAEFFIHVITPYFFVAILGLGITLLLLNFLEFILASSYILVVAIFVYLWLNKYSNLKSQNTTLSSFFTVFMTFIESNLALFLGSLSLLWGKSPIWTPERSNTKILKAT